MPFINTKTNVNSVINGRTREWNGKINSWFQWIGNIDLGFIFEKENVVEKPQIVERDSKEALIREHTRLKKECSRFSLPFLEIQENYEKEITKAYEFFAKS